MMTAKSSVGIVLRGMLMGVADLIPGVSGGTMALITGIYERLVDAIAGVGPHTVKLVLRGRFTEAWRSVDALFLILLGAGIGASVLLFARILSQLLETMPHRVWALFFGLIIASALVLYRAVRAWSVAVVLSTVFGALIAWQLTHLSALHVQPSTGVVFGCGMLAICAWILPGISGSFILLVLGMYEYIIGSIKSLEFSVLLVFAAGAGSGLLLFTRLLKWALKRFHDAIMGLLTGFLLGSLQLLWPWQLSLPGAYKAGGVPVSPSEWSAVTGIESDLLGCGILTLVGMMLVLVLDRFGRVSAVQPPQTN